MQLNSLVKSAETVGLPTFFSVAIMALLGTEFAPAFQSALEGTSAWGGLQSGIALALSPLNDLSALVALPVSVMASIISTATVAGFVAREKTRERQARMRTMATKALYLGFFVSAVIFTGFLLPIMTWAAGQAGDAMFRNLAFLCFGLLLALPVVLGINAVRSASVENG